MVDLASLVEGLPSELYNKIYDLTFGRFDGEHHINSSHKPPSCLQTDHATRQRLLDSYYGKDSIFYLSPQKGERWLESLPVVPSHCPFDHAQIRFTWTYPALIFQVKSRFDYWYGGFPCAIEKLFEHSLTCGGRYARFCLIKSLEFDKDVRWVSVEKAYRWCEKHLPQGYTLESPEDIRQPYERRGDSSCSSADTSYLA